MKQFYVYIYYDPRPGKDEVPVYVGKGQGDRKNDHWRKNAKNPMMRGLVAQCKALGLAPIIETLELEDETEAFAYEMALIAIFGRRDLGTGTLFNLTDGGEGSTGLVYTADMRLTKSLQSKGRKLGPMAETTKRKLSIVRTGSKASDETLAKLRVSQKNQAFHDDPAYRAKLSEACRGRIFTDEWRAKLRESSAKRWANQEAL